jgi:ribosomal protein L24
MEERHQFLDAFNANTLGEADSSDCSPEETRTFMKRDTGAELIIGDKIYVIQGELQQANGKIMNFADGGQTVCFKPSNIEGFEDTINLDRSMLVKYFEQGDRVRVVEGKYQTEVGIVVNVDPENVTMPKVKLESTDIEATILTQFMKMRNDRDNDDIKTVNQRRKKGVQNYIASGDRS